MAVRLSRAHAQCTINPRAYCACPVLGPPLRKRVTRRRKRCSPLLPPIPTIVFQSLWTFSACVQWIYVNGLFILSYSISGIVLFGERESDCTPLVFLVAPTTKGSWEMVGNSHEIHLFEYFQILTRVEKRSHSCLTQYLDTFKKRMAS